MAIPGKYRARCAYHFTALENLESILDCGLLATNMKDQANIPHRDVANPDIQQRRNAMEVPGSGGLCVHDFVPFYFAQRTPMLLAVINQKNVDQEEILYFEISLISLEQREDVFFTDASANTVDPPNFYNLRDATELKRLNWELIDSKKWKFEGEEKQQRMAELLIPRSVLVKHFCRIIACEARVASTVRSILQSRGMDYPVVVATSFPYFYEPASNWSLPLITGPVALYKLFLQTIEAVVSSPRRTMRYRSLEEAVQAIRLDFNAISELKEINDLRADYGPHRDTVGAHSRRVAHLVRNSEEFLSLDHEGQLLLELAAYLHDIGKGPKSRWNNGFMDSADNNHASKSLPMLKRILTEDIGGLSNDLIRRLVMLVTYDDLLGDIAARGRDQAQLREVIHSAVDLMMLVALSKADIGSISQKWLDDVSAKIDNIRDEAVSDLLRGQTL